jgi:hypothetical protein
MRTLIYIVAVLVGVSMVPIGESIEAPKKKGIQFKQPTAKKQSKKTSTKKTVKKSKSAKKTTKQAKSATKALKSASKKSAVKRPGKKVIKSKNYNEPTINAAVTTRGGRTRINFEDLLIQGQLKRSDTIYLFNRGENQLRSLVKKREDFRREIYENYLN